jgi:tetratricopeptide (TPR) repeat protein
MAQDARMSGALKLCLIYAPEDQRLYAQLKNHLIPLERRGLIEFWDPQNILAGSERERELAARLAEADLFVYLLSPDLFASEYYSQSHLMQIMQRYQRGEVRIVPVILRPIALDLLDPPFARLEPLPTNKKAVSGWKNRDAALLDIVLGVRRVVESMSGQPGDVEGGEAGPEPPALPFWYVPLRRNVYFAGRNALLDTLHNSLLKPGEGWPAIQALTGLGGVGKTQLAVEYAYRYWREYQAVLWARADTPENLVSDGLTLAHVLRLPERKDANQEVVLGALKRWLQQHASWLLILDNVNELALVSDFLPVQYRGHVLLTTRIQATGAVAPSLSVPPLEVPEGARFLLRRARLFPRDISGDESNLPQFRQAQEIVRELEGLPLALDQAGAYIEEVGESLEGYRQIFRRREADLLSYRGQAVAGHPSPISATFALAFEQVAERSQPAASLLRLCAFLHPASIPERLLLAEAFSSEQPASLFPGIADEAELNVALSVLFHFSLIRRDPTARSLSVHRLVQSVVRGAMTEQEQRLWATRALILVSRAWPERGAAGWERCQAYLSHALVCADLIARWDVCTEDALRLLHEVGAYLSERASYQEAERLLLQALALGERLHDGNDPTTASVLQDLGWLAHRRGQQAQAEERYQRALAMRERALGEHHPQTAQTLYTLGLLYLNQRELVRAEQLLQRALAIQEQQLGPEHPHVAETLNALGMLARARGEYEQAEVLYRRALAIREQRLGADAPETATSVSNLAALAFNQGNYAEAGPLYQRALEIRERILGAEHPDTAAILSVLALLADLQKRYAEGEPLARRALAIQEETLGREHRETAQTLLTLAMLCYHQGNLEQAEAHAQEALAVRERVLSPHDPNLIVTLNNLALIYRARKKYEPARPLLQRALILSETVHGKEDARTVGIRENLASLPAAQNNQSVPDDASHG